VGRGVPACALDDDRRDGAIDEAGLVLGTMVHGIVESASLRAALLDALSRRRGVELARDGDGVTRDQAYDRIANVVERHLDVETIWELARGEP
jgi:adenosylcobyric acid synthase